MSLTEILLIIALIYLIISVSMFSSLWIIFEKAGKKGFLSIIPIYNLIVLIKISGKSLWWFLPCFIPIFHLPFLFYIFTGLAKRFNKNIGFAFGLLFLFFLFFPILAYGKAEYKD